MTDDAWERLELALEWAPRIAEELKRKLQRLVERAPSVAEQLEDLDPLEIRQRFEAVIARAADEAVQQEQLSVPEMLTLPVWRQERLRDLRLVIAATELGAYLTCVDSVLQAAAQADLLEEAEGRFATLMETMSFGATAVMLLEGWFDDAAAGG